MAEYVKNYLKTTGGQMVHSNSYDQNTPVGPSGENLFSGQPANYWSVGQATNDWYSEVKDCKSLPGCTSSKGGQIGHFTAMNWKGVQSIGCASNSNGLKGCVYKGNDNKDCSTPNMQGCNQNNAVPAATTSFDNCKNKVLDCFGESALPQGVSEAFDLNATVHVPQIAHFAVPAKEWTVWATIALAAMVSTGALAFFLRARSAATRHRMLMLDAELAAAEEMDE
jgi:hypothetical protein